MSLVVLFTKTISYKKQEIRQKSIHSIFYEQAMRAIAQKTQCHVFKEHLYFLIVGTVLNKAKNTW